MLETKVKAQSITEYVALFMIVTAAIALTHKYVYRSMNARLKQVQEELDPASARQTAIAGNPGSTSTTGTGTGTTGGTGTGTGGTQDPNCPGPGCPQEPPAQDPNAGSPGNPYTQQSTVSGGSAPAVDEEVYYIDTDGQRFPGKWVIGEDGNPVIVRVYGEYD
jgi:hypothetical protein